MTLSLVGDRHVWHIHPLDTALAKQALGLFLAKADRNVKRMTPTQIDEGQQLVRSGSLTNDREEIAGQMVKLPILFEVKKLPPHEVDRGRFVLGAGRSRPT